MNGRRVAGLALVVPGIVVLVAGACSGRDRDTVVDAGPLKVQTEEREGVALPPLLRSTWESCA